MKKLTRKAAANIIVPLLLMAMVFALLMGCDPGPVYQEPVGGTVCRWDFPSSADGLGIPNTVYLPRGYNPAKAYPVWVELHALYATPIIDNDPNNVFSNDLKRVADERGWILLAPWGRSLHSMFVDGISRAHEPYYEPEIYDDFSKGAGDWDPKGGDWAARDGRYVQQNTSATWKEAVHEGSLGKDYSVRVKVRELSTGGGTSAFGVNLRRNDAGGCYHLDLYRGSDNKRYVRFYKLVNEKGVLEWQGMSTMVFEWAPLTDDGWINVKFSCYDDYLEVYVNEKLVNMQAGYNATPYGYGMDVPGEPLPAGMVSLASYGGVHEFDEVRIQNEYPYGERDVLDSVLGLMEKYRIDPTRIYVAGHSQGGLGAFTFGLHHPDLCAALRPADGFSDLYYDYTWLKENYPRNPGPPFADVNDGRLTDYIRELAGGEPQGGPERMSVLNGSSARYILENGMNNHWRIVHGTPDSNVPNSHEPVQINWWAPWLFLWVQSRAPEPYSMATAEFANGKDIADKLREWSAYGGYSSVYVTHPTIGHGFLESYGDTANGLQSKTLDRRPAEVAYKTYDDVNTGAWWLRLQIPKPGRNEPGMARVRADAAGNSAAIHARNLARLRLDLPWMGLDAEKELTFTLDDDTSPNAFDIADTRGALDLELLGPWTAAAYEVKVDGSDLALGSGYNIEGASLLIPGLAVAGGHALTIAPRGALPANLAPNAGVEGGAGAAPEDWAKDARGADFTSVWEDLEAHGGIRSLRVKEAAFVKAGDRALWSSTPFAVEKGEEYLLTAFSKARLLRGARQVVGLTWYGDSGQLGETVWAKGDAAQGFALNREWSPLALTATAPEGAKTARISVGLEAEAAGRSGGSAFFDDISFTRLESRD